MFGDAEEQSFEAFFVGFQFGQGRAGRSRQLEQRGRREAFGDRDHDFVLAGFLRIGEFDAGGCQGGAIRGRRSGPAQLVAIADLRAHFVHRARAHDGAAVEHHDLLADALDVAQQVRAQDDALAGLGDQVFEQLQHGDAPGRIQAVGGLVEQQQLRIVHQCRGQVEPLQVAGRVFFQPAIAQFAEANVIEHLVGAAAGVAMRHTIEITREGHELDALEHGNRGGDLGHVAHATAQLRRAVQNIAAQDRAAARVGRKQSQQDLDQRALAGAVVADQADGAGRQRKVDVAQGLHAAEAATDVVDVDQLHGAEMRAQCREKLTSPKRERGGIEDALSCSLACASGWLERIAAISKDFQAVYSAG